MPDFHPWRKSVFQEDASLTVALTLVLSAHLRILTNRASRRHWVMVISMRLLILEMMSGDSLTLWVLLSTCCSRVEEVVDALESSSSLTRNLATFLHGVLELDV